MESGYNNGSIAPINRVNLGDDAQVGLQRYGNNTNYYDTSQVAGVSESNKYMHNPDPLAMSSTSKGNHYGLNPFQNNFSEQILKYTDDGNILTGRTICIG